MSESLPSEIALFPLSSVLFPSQPLRLQLFERRYLDLMRDRAELDPIFGVVLTPVGWEVGDEPTIHRVGTAARLEAAVLHDDGRFSIAVRGARRFRVLSEDWSRGYLVGAVSWLEEDERESLSDLAERATDVFAAYATELATSLGDAAAVVNIAGNLRDALSSDSIARGWQIASQLPLNSWQLQGILEIERSADRLREIIACLERERRRLRIAGPAAGGFEHVRTSFSPN